MAVWVSSWVNALTDFARFLNMPGAFLLGRHPLPVSAGTYNLYDALNLIRDCLVFRATTCQVRQLNRMIREFSAGGVVLRRMRGRWWIAAIEPHKTTDVIALPKGNIDSGERPADTAQREIHEETGVAAELIRKLSDVKYVYVRSWAGGERVFKVVSFYLFNYRGGTIDRIAPAMRKEVRRAFWLPLEEAAERLSYRGEKEVAKLAQKYVDEQVNK